MRTAWKLGFAIVMMGLVGCSDVKFEQAVQKDCGADGVACVTKCTGADCYQQMTVSKTVGRGMVDFLIVDDNSGSMSADQQKMATKFPMFLDSLKQLDYRIAITTTDISSSVSQAYSETNTKPPVYNPPRAINQNGALQDGNLIVFGSGKKYLEGNDGSVSATNTSYFNSAIQRSETLHCGQSGYTDCPSDDERAVFAANLAIDKNEFIRSGSHLAIVILSNEDERGMSSANSAGRPNASTYSNDMSLINLYKRERYDLPQTLVDKVKSKFPGKSVSVHPIVVKPNDLNCLSQESDPAKNIRAKEGWTYQELYQLVLGQETSSVKKSTLSTICDSDYTTTLKTIGDNMQKLDPLPFTCRDDNYTVSFTSPSGVAYTSAQAAAVSYTADFTAMKLTINTILPAGTKVTLNYKCAK